MTPERLLNPDQARHLLSVLRHADETVATIERVLTGDDASLLRPVELDLSADEERGVHDEVVALAAVIAGTAESFGLVAEPRDGRRVIRSRLSTLWAGLEDARPPKLGRYGDVHPRLETALDPLIDALIARVLAILAIVDRSG